MLTFPTVAAPPSLSEYEQVAAELGLVSPALQHRRIVAALTRDEIPVYRLDRVSEHMAKVAQQVAKRSGDNYSRFWWWEPLRAVDAAGDPCSGSRTFTTPNDNTFNGCVGDEPYRLAVPLAALKLAQRVCAVVPGAKLFVTDIGTSVRRRRSRDADPFMAVWGGLEMVPFAVWDEPGF